MNFALTEFSEVRVLPWCSDVLAPRDGAALVDFLHRYAGYEAVRGGAVPVVLAGLEEHAIARANHVDRSAAALHESDALGD